MLAQSLEELLSVPSSLVQTTLGQGWRQHPGQTLSLTGFRDRADLFLEGRHFLIVEASRAVLLSSEAVNQRCSFFNSMLQREWINLLILLVH